MSSGDFADEQQQILRSIAEDMKMPFLRIMSQAQLSQLEASQADLSGIETTADAALRLLDGYIISTQIYNGQQELLLQPVSITAGMYDAKQYLSRLAKLHDCEIEVRVPRSIDLVMANPVALQTTLVSLGYSLISSLVNMPAKKQFIIFTAKRTKRGVVAGVYSPGIDISAETLRRARHLRGRARQPVTDLAQGSGAGIFIADTLLTAMSSELKTTRFSMTGGLAATFLPSHQLALL